MTNKSTQFLFKETWILSVSALITKILSALYRVPLQNIVGNRGFFVYQQVYPLYGLCTAVALTGIPMFVSQIIAEQKEHPGHLQRYLIIGALVLGISSAGILFLSAFQIACWMGDHRLTPLIKVLACFYLLAPIEAVLRGLYQGKLQMMPTAISQVMEQIIRVIVIIIAALMYRQGFVNYYQMGTWAHGGAGIGAIVAIIVLCSYHLPSVINNTSADITTVNLGKRFLTDGLLLSLFGGLLVLLQTIDSFTVFKTLQQYQWPHPQSLKGIFDRAQPLAQLGIVIAVSSATTILPRLSQSKKQTMQPLINATMHVTLTLATSCGVGMAVLMPQINTLLYKDAQQSNTLAIYVLAVIFISYAIVVNTIMQAQHQQWRNLGALVIALIIKYIANIFGVAQWGCLGASVATLLASIVLAGIIYFNSGLQLRQSLMADYYLLKLIFVECLMVGFIWGLNHCWRFLEPLNRVTSVWEVSISIIAAVLLVVILSFRCHLLTPLEWQMVPGGSWIINKLGENNEIR